MNEVVLGNLFLDSDKHAVAALFATIETLERLGKPFSLRYVRVGVYLAIRKIELVVDG